MLGTRPAGDTTLRSERTLFSYSTQGLWAASGPSHKSRSQGLGLGITSGLFRDLANAHQIPKPCRTQTTHPDDTVAAQDLRPCCLVHVVGISGNCG